MSIQSPVTLRKLYNYLHWLHQAITESLIQACHQDRASPSIFTFAVTTKTEKSSSRVDIPIKGKDILIIGGEVCFPLFSKSMCIFISCLLNHGIIIHWLSFGRKLPIILQIWVSGKFQHTTLYMS